MLSDILRSFLLRKSKKSQPCPDYSNFKSEPQENIFKQINSDSDEVKDDVKEENEKKEIQTTLL